MALIHCPSLAFYSVLLFLVGFALGHDSCKKPLEKLLVAAQAEAERLKLNPAIFPDGQKVFVIAERDLRHTLVQLNEATGSMKRGLPAMHVEFQPLKLEEFEIKPEGAYHSVKFTVRNIPREETGTARIACKDCSAIVQEFEQLRDAGRLHSCVVDATLNGYSLIAGPGIQIDFQVPIKTLEGILTNLMASLPPLEEEEWTAKDATVYAGGTKIYFWEEPPRDGDIVDLRFDLPAMGKVPAYFLEKACALIPKGSRMHFKAFPARAKVERKVSHGEDEVDAAPSGSDEVDGRLPVAATPLDVGRRPQSPKGRKITRT